MLAQSVVRVIGQSVGRCRWAEQAAVATMNSAPFGPRHRGVPLHNRCHEGRRVSCARVAVEAEQSPGPGRAHGTLCAGGRRGQDLTPRAPSTSSPPDELELAVFPGLYLKLSLVTPGSSLCAQLLADHPLVRDDGAAWLSAATIWCIA